jgi:anthranilate phosphoribosyltransferase
MIEVKDGHTEELIVSPGDFGLEAADLSDVAGGTPEENAEVTRAVLAGERSPRRDLVVLNAAAAILVGGLADDFAGAVSRAQEAIDSAAAARVLESLVASGGDR